MRVSSSLFLVFAACGQLEGPLPLQHAPAPRLEGDTIVRLVHSGRMEAELEPCG